MTISENYNNFLRTYQRECRKRGMKVQRMEIKDIAMDISEAQQDIQRKLNVVIGTYTITLGADNNLYTLPSNFGNLKFAIMGDIPIDVVSNREILNMGSLSGAPTMCAEYVSGHDKKLLVYPTPTDEASLTVYYSVDSLYYSPSGTTSQDWGAFDGDSFTGNLILPDRYNKAINLYVLGLYFDDIEVKYKEEIMSLKGGHSNHAKLEYRLGIPKKKAFIAGSAAVGVSISNKVLQLSLSQSGTGDPVIIYNFQNSFSDLPTLARTSTGVYTITLSSAFTSGKTFLYEANLDRGAVNDEFEVELEQTSEDVITMKVYDSVNVLTDGFNAVHLRIEVAR